MRVIEYVRNFGHISPRFPRHRKTKTGSNRANRPGPYLPGSPRRSGAAARSKRAEMGVASAQPGALVKGEGVEINFDGADIQAVAKTLLGDFLKLNFVVDPRVQGNVTLASAGPIPRKDVLPAFESALRMSNAAIVRDGNLIKIVPSPNQARR